MKYQNPPYLAEGVKVIERINLFTSEKFSIPIPEYPISARENFIRAAKRENPIWVPNALTDVQSYFVRGPIMGTQGGPKPGNEYENGERYVDWFGADWTWEKSAGGPMLTPGAPAVLEDITEWESVVKFPDLSAMPWKEQAEAFMKNVYNPDMVMNINIGSGCTERLVAVMGGYVEAMLAMAMEPEAVKDFLMAFAEFSKKQIDILCDLFPIDMFTIHDDWGTERDTFFSEQMMEDIVFEPVKSIVQHIKSKGKLFMQHTCGQVTRFVPYMIDMGTDLMQIQRRAVDIPMIKEKYGDKIGVDVRIEGLVPEQAYTREEYAAMIRKTVELYGKGGGLTTTTQYSKDPEVLWNGIFDLYNCSSEYYEK